MIARPCCDEESNSDKWTLDAVVFIAALYFLTLPFALAGVAWAVVIAYAFACVNRAIALNRIIPGISSKLLRRLLAVFVLLTTIVLVRTLVSR